MTYPDRNGAISTTNSTASVRHRLANTQQMMYQIQIFSLSRT